MSRLLQHHGTGASTDVVVMDKAHPARSRARAAQLLDFAAAHPRWVRALRRTFSWGSAQMCSTRASRLLRGRGGLAVA